MLIFFSLIPVALLLANTPILSLFVVLEFKPIVPVFTAVGIPVISFNNVELASPNIPVELYHSR